MSDGEAAAERAFQRRLADRLTVLKLRIDLGEIKTAAAFRHELERDGYFRLDDLRVRRACLAAGLEAWIGRRGGSG